MVGDGYCGEVDQSEIRQENDKWQGWVRRRLDGPWRPWLWPRSDPKMMRFPEISSNVPRALLLYTTIHWIEPSKTHPFYPTMPQIHLIITYRKDLFSIWWRTLEKGPGLFEQFTLQRVLFSQNCYGLHGTITAFWWSGGNFALEKSSWGLLVKQRPHMKCYSSLNFASTCVCLHLLEPEVNTHLVCVLTHQHSVFTPATVLKDKQEVAGQKESFRMLNLKLCSNTICLYSREYAANLYEWKHNGISDQDYVRPIKRFSQTMTGKSLVAHFLPKPQSTI